MKRWTLPEGWEWVQVGKIADLHGGSTPRRHHQDYFGGEIVWVTPTDLTMNGGIPTITSSKVTLTQAGLDSCSAKLLPVGTVLFSSRASIGKIGIAGIELATNQGFINFVCRQEIYNRYLAWALRFLTPQIQTLASSTTYLEISKSAMRQFPIPIPYPSDPARSLAEQRRIVARLEALLGEVRAMRDLIRAMRQQWDELMQSALGEVFPSEGQALPEGWEWKPLPEVCKINPQRPRIQRNDETPTSFVPMQAVDDQTGAIVDMQIRPYGEVKRGYTYFEENDVLMAKITPSMENGKAAIARDLIDGIGFGTTEFHVFHPSEGILPEWIFFFIRRKAFRDRAKMSFKGAVGQQRVPEDFLLVQEIPIPYPNNLERSIAEQRRIVARLEAVQAEVSAARQALEADERRVAELEQSILAAAFRGEM